MTSTDQPLVVARFKGGDPKAPRFTQSCTIEELFTRLAKDIPVDSLYLVRPDKDGLGFSLREAGVITLQLTDVARVVKLQEPTQAAPSVLPPPLPSHSQPTELSSAIEEPTEVPVTYKMDSDQYSSPSPEEPFKFAPPRPQAELLAEMGLEIAPAPEVAPKALLAPLKGKSKGKPKSHIAVPVDDGQTFIEPTVEPKSIEEVKLDDARSMARLPKVKSRMGSAKVTAVSAASPAQAAAASRFGETY